MPESTDKEMPAPAASGETCQQRNMRMGWGCRCHGETFCPELKFVGYSDDVPMFEPRH